jgi:hypothetical protein
MNKVIYVVSANTYKDGWGAEISILFASVDESKAKDFLKAILPTQPDAAIYNIPLDTSVEIDLGGYIE